MRRLAILILLGVFALKSELLPIRTYTTADGLAADHINRITADARGFLWFCTREGLSRFDGNRFVTYGVEEGLPHAVVTGLIETRSGDHWIGTRKGFSRITTNGPGPRFSNYRLGPETDPNDFVALLEARSGKFLGATAGGLFEWTDPLSFRRSELLRIPGIEITALGEDVNGDLWIGTKTGIYICRATGGVQHIAVEDGLPGNSVNRLLRDSKGRMWAALRGGLARMGQRTAGNWGVEKVYTPKSGLASYNVGPIAQASDGVLWIGTDSGISRIAPDDGDRPSFRTLTRADGLSDRWITSLAEDQAGNMWAGTEGAGAMRIDRGGFTTYREQDGLLTDRVYSVFADRDGELVAVTVTGTGGRSVDIFDGTRFHGVAPARFANNPSWGSNQVLLHSRTREWWAATDEGLCRFGAMPAMDLDRRQPLACYSRDSIFRIFEDSKGGVWASAQLQKGQAGLMRWDPESNSVHSFPAPRVPGYPTDDLVSAFAEDRQGNIWMGLYRGGLYRYNGHEFQLFQTNDGVPRGIIYTLLTDREGRLWIGSNGGGLGRVDHPGDAHLQIELYGTGRGMASNNIRCLTEDEPGRIYAGGGKGVDRVDPRTGHVRYFSTANGLAHGLLLSAFRDHYGSLWFATTQGLSKLVPAVERPRTKPRILITDLQIGGVSYPVSQLGETRVAGLELKPSRNQFQVEFVGLDYELGDVLRYSYILEGADSGWSPLRNQHTVNYAALTGGKYRFLVKAVTSEGVESAAPAEIDFTVLAPVWQRWWFRGLALALAVALVFAAHRYRVLQMVRLERMRMAIATDLHDDIGASLSQIAILSEVARIGGNGRGRPGEPLERVASLARELVDSMGDIVWSIRSEPHGIDSLIRRMREFALDLLASQGIEFELRTPDMRENVQLSLQSRRQLFLMFKECIHNASRHSHATTVMAVLKVEDHEVVLTVEDNGIGLRPDEAAPGSTGGTGIPGLHRRAESLGGRMQLTSRPGEGCRVAIYLPTRHWAFAKASL